MSATSLTIRLDKDLKKNAASVAKLYGIDLSTATRAFYTQMVNTNAIPLSLNYEQPNKESIEAIKQTEEMIKTGEGKEYTNAHDLIEDALNR